MVSQRDPLLELVEVLQDQIRRVAASRDFYARQLADLGADHDAALDRIDWLEQTNRVLSAELRRYQQTKDRRGLRLLIASVSFVAGSLFDGVTGYVVSEGLDDVRGIERAAAQAAQACEPGSTQTVAPSGVGSSEQFGTPTVQQSPAAAMGAQIPAPPTGLVAGAGAGAASPTTDDRIPITLRGGEVMTSEAIARSQIGQSIDDVLESASLLGADDVPEGTGVHEDLAPAAEGQGSPSRQRRFFPIPNKDTGSFITLAPDDPQPEGDAGGRESEVP